MGFVDRAAAGRRLAQQLAHLSGDDVVVVGLPRGGVPVAAEVAQALGAPLDIIAVRKLGVPFQPELAMGAIGEDGARVLDEEVIRVYGISPAEIETVEARERLHLERLVQRFRDGRAPTPLAGRVVVVVDDGIATGSTARAACHVARAQGAQRVVLAVPVAPVGWRDRLTGTADELVSVSTPDPFSAVGAHYADFTQTTDEQVIDCLRRAAVTRPAGRDEEVTVEAGTVTVAGHLAVPASPRGVVVFAHGSGSSRHSPRNRQVAAVLNDAGLATLLVDLLTREEELDRGNVFDVDMLAQRLIDVTGWVRCEASVAGLTVGYFGASTGAAAALAAASRPGAGIGAIVSRGGRPDLAGPHLASVTAPTLLIVGGLDDVVLRLNRQARSRLRCRSQLIVVPGATHLFEEPGTLQTAAVAARDWFLEHLPGTHTLAR
jgi:putative phosphoribosyl transferase